MKKTKLAIAYTVSMLIVTAYTIFCFIYAVSETYSYENLTFSYAAIFFSTLAATITAFMNKHSLSFLFFIISHVLNILIDFYPFSSFDDDFHIISLILRGLLIIATIFFCSNLIISCNAKNKKAFTQSSTIEYSWQNDNLRQELEKYQKLYTDKLISKKEHDTMRKRALGIH